MYSIFTLARKYCRYLLTAANGQGHGIHSPFVFDFIRNVLNDETHYPEYVSVEKLRRKLLSDHSPVPVEDYGAGSALTRGQLSQSVASIAGRAAKRPKYAQLLFRMVRYYHPHYIIELGTSLGISTAYLAAGDNRSLITTSEGNQSVANIARRNFNELSLDNIRMVTGPFDNTLPQIIAGMPHVGMAFIDGNHREKPTLRYFHQLLEKVSASSMLIFDDIHWSGEMENAWRQIVAHPSVMLSVDLFQFGIVFFRPEFKVKQHFTIRF